MARGRTAGKAALKGHFYAVGVGPGDPGLVTLRAAEVIRAADLVLAPRSCRAEESLALAAVRHLLRRQEVIEQPFAMERDARRTRLVWREAARLIVRRCRRGQAVVQITIGDPLIYSTSCYLIAAVRRLLPASRVHVVPGISAFQAAAAAFGEPLVIQEDRALLMPATDLRAVGRALGQCETLILYKAGGRLRELARLLERRGLIGRARLAAYVGLPGRERFTRNLAAAAREAGSSGYMATVIVHLGRKSWKRPALAGLGPPAAGRRGKNPASRLDAGISALFRTSSLKPQASSPAGRIRP